MFLDERCKKRLRSLHRILPDSAPLVYAYQFASVFNSHDSGMMKDLLSSLGDIEDMKVIARFFTTHGHSKPTTTPTASAASAAAALAQISSKLLSDNKLPFFYGKHPLLEFSCVSAYLKYLDEMYLASPDAVFTIITAHSLQTNDANIIMIAYSFTTTVLEPADPDHCCPPSACATSLDEDDPSRASSVRQQKVNIRGSLALYLSNTTGKLYKMEFFSQLLPVKKT